MKPVLSKLTPQRRTLLFAPVLLGAFLVAFLVAAVATDVILVGVLAAIPASVLAAWLLLGWPHVRRPDGRPLVDARWKPYLFFPLAPALAFVGYLLLGAVLTQLKVDPTLSTYLSLGLSVAGACAGAYLLVGFPHVVHGARHAYARVPADRRPFLFFPIAVVLFLVLFLALVVGSTQALARLRDDALLLNLQVLVLVPLSLLLAGLGAYLLVGFPKPQRRPSEYLPKVTGRRRPHLFLLTFLLAGVPITILLGVAITSFVGSRLPAPVILPLAVVLGYALSLGLAALWWGTPARWRQFDDYRPGLPPRARAPLYAAAGVAVLIAVTVGFGLAGADLFWGLLTGAFLGLVVALQLAGIMARLAARRRAPTLVPDLPDGVKPLIIFPAWLLVAALAFAVLTYALPDLILWNALGSLLLGLALSFLLVEQPLWRDLIGERRREREKRRAFEARRKEALAREIDDPTRPE